MIDPVALARAALEDLAVDVLVARALRKTGPRVRVVAIGKAAPGMAEGALRRLGDRVEACLVVAPDGAPDVAGATNLRAGHPEADARSLRAGKACLAHVVTSETRRVVALVSGGASALVSVPSEGVTFAAKRRVVRALLASGASIQEINVVRKHLSRIKGGGLAAAAYPNSVESLVVSDVIGGGVSDVGSGPGVPDPSRTKDARAIVARYAPEHLALPFARTLSPRDRRAIGPAGRVLLAPETLGTAMAARLRKVGFRTRVLPASQEPIDDLAEQYLARARRLGPGQALVRMAEPSIRVHGRGRGGRSTHLAARVGGNLPDGFVFLAMATDGVDGSSGTGGALVDGRFSRQAAGAIAAALAAYDTGPLHQRLGTALPRAPTGHNLADLHVLLRLR